jgi:hypothetical protein
MKEMGDLTQGIRPTLIGVLDLAASKGSKSVHMGCLQIMLRYTWPILDTLQKIKFLAG